MDELEWKTEGVDKNKIMNRLCDTCDNQYNKGILTKKILED